MPKKQLPDGYIWLQDNEDQASAECGCTVYRSHKGSGPALILCPMHSAAPELLAALEEVEQHAMKYGGVPKSATLLWERVQAIIAKAKEKG